LTRNTYLIHTKRPMLIGIIAILISATIFNLYSWRIAALLTAVLGYRTFSTVSLRASPVPCTASKNKG
jgi:hypothetical protein